MNELQHRHLQNIKEILGPIVRSALSYLVGVLLGVVIIVGSLYVLLRLFLGVLMMMSSLRW